jgi:predicted unusual protein kinase regulating ubiquinone biosynthesis (AarF/ABC1/UbiB family)
MKFLFYLILVVQIFVEFDHVTLASSSLAKLQAATTHDGEKVFVKVAIVIRKY